MKMPLFGSGECTKESNSSRYISTDLPCAKILTTQKKNCCKQKDLPFILNVASIYNSKTSGGDDEQIQGVSDYVKEFESYHTGVLDDHNNTHIHTNTKKGKYMIGLVDKYNSTVPLVIHQEKKFTPVPSSVPRVIYMVNDIPRIQIPMHRYVTVTGNKSTAVFRDIELFRHKPNTRGFENILGIIEGKSFLKIDIPLVFTEPMTDFFLLEDITSSMLEIGRGLGRNNAQDTILYFQFRTKTLHKRLIQVTLDSLGFSNISSGAIVEENIRGYTISVEVKEVRGTSVACILKVISDASIISEKESTSEILDLVATDFITFEETSVRKYLEDDVKNMVIFENNNKPHLTNITDLKTSMEEGIVYACREVNEKLFQDPSNVESETELFNARRVGTIAGYINADQLRDAMKIAGGDNSSRIFYLTDPVKNVPTVISKRVYDGEDDLVSSNHCQVGSEGGVFDVLHVNIV